jgi:ketosteroid isomerase-like protein
MNIVARFLVHALAIGAVLLAVPPAQAAELTTQDYIDIEQLYATYNHAIDEGDGEAWAATFTPDGSFNTFKGKDALVGFIKFWREKRNGANRRHWNTNLRITPAEDGAKATVLLMILDVGTQPPSIVMTGQYTDVLVKTPQGWRFKSRASKGDAPPAPAKP